MYISVFFTSIVTFLLASYPASAQRQNSEYIEKLSSGIEKFSFSLLLRTAIEKRNENIAVSPFSVWAMMSILSEGAGGYTEKELTLGLAHPEDNLNKNILRGGFKEIYTALNVRTPTTRLETVNAIYIDPSHTINPGYSSLVRDIYSTQIQSIDFRNPSSVNTINNFVDRATRGRVTEIVYSEDLRNADMILINAIFFKGQWTNPFNASQTKVETFVDENNRPIGQVNMMYQRGPFPYVNMKSFQSYIVELPYGKATCKTYVDDPIICRNLPNNELQENRLSMLVIVPYFRVPLTDVFQTFTRVNVSEIFKQLARAAQQFEDDEVDVYLPRFSVTSDIVMNKFLKEMGMHEAFDPAYADFSKLTLKDKLYLSRVIHKAQLEVTEEGTVASGVTVGELSNRNTPPKFVANKPFLYIIVEKSTNIVVFGGTYVKPSLF